MTNLFKMPLILKAKIKVFTSLDIIYLIFIKSYLFIILVPENLYSIKQNYCDFNNTSTYKDWDINEAPEGGYMSVCAREKVKELKEETTFFLM